MFNKDTLSKYLLKEQILYFNIFSRLDFSLHNFEPTLRGNMDW